jgi:hypothetical protein
MINIVLFGKPGADLKLKGGQPVAVRYISENKNKND